MRHKNTLLPVRATGRHRTTQRFFLKKAAIGQDVLKLLRRRARNEEAALVEAFHQTCAYQTVQCLADGRGAATVAFRQKTQAKLLTGPQLGIAAVRCARSDFHARDVRVVPHTGH